MAIKNKILKFRSIGFVRLILILVLAIPAGFVSIPVKDYSGRLKIESVNSNKRKPFIGYHFLQCHEQLVDCLKNKSFHKIRLIEFGRKTILHLKIQRSVFLIFKNYLTDFLQTTPLCMDNDVEKLTVV